MSEATATDTAVIDNVTGLPIEFDESGVAEEPIAPIPEEDLAAETKQWETDGRVGPKPGTPRWNQVYWEAQEGKRAKDVIKELEQDKKALRQLNTEALEALKATATAPARAAAPVEVTPDLVKSKISELRQEKLKAAEEMDLKTVESLNDTIADLKDYLKDLTAVKPPTREDITKTVKEQQDYETALKWVKSVGWADPGSEKYDPFMSSAAQMVTGELRKQGMTDINTLAAKTQEIVEKRFGYNGNGTKAAIVAGPTVRGVGGTPLGTEAPQSTLSAVERHIAINQFPEDSPAEAAKKYQSAKDLIAKRRGK